MSIKGDVMTQKKMYRVLDRMDFCISKYAGEEIKNKVFEDKTSKEVSSYRKIKKARWVKGAIDRLDKLAERETRMELMRYCGAMCASIAGRKWTEEAKVRRKKYNTVDEFLEAEGVVREGNIFYTSYQPQKDGKRCYCTLVNGLPAEETMSPTYCYCSAGHVKAFWEEALGRPVKVQLVQSAISGAKDCKFQVHLVQPS